MSFGNSSLDGLFGRIVVEDTAPESPESEHPLCLMKVIAGGRWRLLGLILFPERGDPRTLIAAHLAPEAPARP